MDETDEQQARFTVGLLDDVFRVLESHGYSLPEDEKERNAACGRSLCSLRQLVTDFEGR